MRIIVTGGGGRLGQFTIKELVDHGHEVLSIDRLPISESVCPSLVIDLLHAEHLAAAFERADGVVHLARKRFPYTSDGFDPVSRTWKTPDVLGDAATFNYNVSISSNVVAAAFGAGVKKLVMGSSLTIYGFYYPARFAVPESLPVDEKYPLRPQDPYSISKLVVERVCDAFARKSEMQIASLRFAGICTDLTHGVLLERRKNPSRWTGPLWTYVDVRDAAVACRLAIETSFSGHEAFNVCAPNTIMKTPTAELAREYLPGIKLPDSRLDGNWSGYDPVKARKMLGFTAGYLFEGQ
jgi:nucleoside-diphosphate-sugar epimerase